MSTSENNSGSNIPEWLKKWPDNVVDTEILSATERSCIVNEVVGREAVNIPISKYPHKLRDAGEVAFLVAIVGGEESLPGAMIRRKDGIIVRLADGINAEDVDYVISAMR